MHHHDTEHHNCGCGHIHAKKQHGCSENVHAHTELSTASEQTCEQGSCDATERNTEDDSGDDDPPRREDSKRFNWYIKGMDCASCARTIEDTVLTIPGVSHAKVLFSTEKLIVDAQTDVTHNVERAVEKAGYSLFDPQKNKIPVSSPPWKTYLPLIILTLMMGLSGLISFYSINWGEIAFTATTLFGLYPIARQSIRQIRSGIPFGIETLMSIAAVGALFIGASAEAAMVLLLFMIGELLESYAANRARSGVTALMKLLPDDAVVIKQGQRITVSAKQLRPGDIIEVAPGARLPADGKLLNNVASFDESALTGESIPVERKKEESISAGSLVIDRVVELTVTSKAGNNAIDRILQLIENAEESRAPIERILDKFSRYYTPAILFIALLTVLIPPLFFAQPWETWIYRGLTLLLIGCPCALVISTPAAITSGLAAATKNGILVKGGAILEQLAKIRQIAFDKTGTLTQGKPAVTDIIPVASITEQQLLSWCAAVENGSSHPLAKAILKEAEIRGIDYAAADNRITLPGVGIQGEINGVEILLSAPGKQSRPDISPEWQVETEQLENQGKTLFQVWKEQQFVGMIALQDTLRDDAKQTLQQLKQIEVRGIMLTGDNPRAAAAIAAQLGIAYKAGLLPQDKVNAVIALSTDNITAMVGDGINDAPAMKAAHVGIAMGSGTDVALDTADAALTQNKLSGLLSVIRISQATHANIRQNITIALGLKAIFLITSLLGITGLWIAVLADSGATALVTANALRLLKKK